MGVGSAAQEGTYDITTDGQVNGYISPRLAFGRGSSFGWLVWVVVGLSYRTNYWRTGQPAIASSSCAGRCPAAAAEKLDIHREEVAEEYHPQ